MNAVTVTGLVKTLDGRRVLRGIDLALRTGEIMALVGPSGSGKSTLLRCLNRLLEPDEGTITFQGRDIREMPPVTLRRSLVLVPQESVMFPGTVYDNVAYGPALQGTADHEHVVRCIADAGLPSSIVHRPADKLSGGEKRRVALARALALRPDVLLLDEPTAGIDPKNVETVEQHIVEFSRSRGLTVLWVTHDVPQAKRVSHRTASLSNGLIGEINATASFHWEGVY